MWVRSQEHVHQLQLLSQDQNEWHGECVAFTGQEGLLIIMIGGTPLILAVLLYLWNEPAVQKRTATVMLSNIIGLGCTALQCLCIFGIVTLQWPAPFAGLACSTLLSLLIGSTLLVSLFIIHCSLAAVLPAFSESLMVAGNSFAVVLLAFSRSTTLACSSVLNSDLEPGILELLSFCLQCLRRCC